MSRATLLQPILDLFENPWYLEVGVFMGETFKEIRAGRRVGVDLEFHFDASEEIAKGNVELNQMSSDVYFSSTDPFASLFDVVFIDGLHASRRNFLLQPK